MTVEKKKHDYLTLSLRLNNDENLRHIKSNAVKDYNLWLHSDEWKLRIKRDLDQKIKKAIYHEIEWMIEQRLDKELSQRNNDIENAILKKIDNIFKQKIEEIKR